MISIRDLTCTDEILNMKLHQLIEGCEENEEDK
jgi:hypothetical protein